MTRRNRIIDVDLDDDDDDHDDYDEIIKLKFFFLNVIQPYTHGSFLIRWMLQQFIVKKTNE